MSNIKLLIKQNNFDEIYKILETDELYKLDSKFIKHIFYRYQDNKKIIKIYEKLFNDYKTDEAFITIGMRIYLNLKDVDAAYKLLYFIKEPKKRNVLPIFQHYCVNNDDLIFNFYKNNIYNKFIIEEAEYKCLITKYKDDKDKLEFIFNDMRNNLLSISNELRDILINKTSKIVNIIDNKCENCGSKLLSIDLTVDEKINLQNNIESVYFNKNKNLNKYKNFLLKNNINMFIDAGNILYFQSGQINYNSFLKIDLIVKHLEKDYNVLVIIHQRHFNNLKKMDNKEKILKLYNSWKKYETPYHLNDDWYFIYGCLLNDKSFIVTNDKLRDHQFKVSEKNNINNTLAKLIDRRVIRYDFKDKKYNNNNLILKFPNEYSTEIQKVNNTWHFPINNGKWLCYK